jgi:hypothetical protein
MLNTCNLRTYFSLHSKNVGLWPLGYLRPLYFYLARVKFYKFGATEHIYTVTSFEGGGVINGRKDWFAVPEIVVFLV